MEFKKYDIKELFVFFLIAILISIFIHLLSCSDTINEKNAQSNSKTLNKLLNNFNSTIEKFKSSLTTESFTSNQNTQYNMIENNMVNVYKDYQNNNIINFRKIKSLDFDIVNMQNRIAYINDLLKKQFNDHYNTDVLFNTNGEINII